MDIQIIADGFFDHSLYIKGYSKKTVRSYRSAISFFCKSLEITKIEEVTDEGVRHFFINGRVHRNWKPATFMTYHKSLIVFFRYCVDKGHLPKNYIEDIETPKIPKTIPKKITTENAKRLLEIILNYPYPSSFLRYRNHAIFATFLYAGLRKSELFNLHVLDVDIENLTLFVRNGKGAKDRIIPMSHTLAQSLKRYVNERKKLMKTCPEFFTSFNRNQGYTDSGLRRVVRTLKDISRIEFTIHRLRHTFATLMIEGGCDIYSLSKMMGHSDISTTTIYLSATAEHLRGQMLKHPLN
ncbi:tyrosine-type recombinase/integrase [Candidatus Ulvibacter alkanivorans]|uniref:tyrosine-type recombinase/integrase n=1 Tax=Candidatus Ulvibacter alkanivorans TaxID=2267620 RepID=UPI000DF19ED0|nr:tyrosine-type recombinase/integrase [Candidatus Ulvibacter alkanivorans]